MTTPGNDPFSGTNIRNILQHIISPKIVSDGSTGYAVNTDVINVDNIYAKGTINGSNLKRYTQTYVSYTSSAYSFSSCLIPKDSAAVYNFIMYTSNGAMLTGTIITGLGNQTVVSNYYNTANVPVYTLTVSGSNVYINQTTDMAPGNTNPFAIVIQQVC